MWLWHSQPPEKMRYHYSPKANETAGPVDMAELNRLAAAGTINDSTPVIPEGSQTWTTYGAVRQGAATAAAADAVAASVSRAGAALKSFSWGSLLMGLLLAFLGSLTLPWSVLAGAARELAVWGRERLLPSSASDLPVLTFYVVVMRNFTLVLSAVGTVFMALLQLFGVFNAFAGHSYHYNPVTAIAGAAGTLIGGYFALAAIALVFEIFAVGVRIANDIKKIAQR